MFDIGFSEMIMLAVIALVAIGPKQLPEVARVVGRTLNELKRATGDLTKTIVDARDTATRFTSDSPADKHAGGASESGDAPLESSSDQMAFDFDPSSERKES